MIIAFFGHSNFTESAKKVQQQKRLQIFEVLLYTFIFRYQQEDIL